MSDEAPRLLDCRGHRCPVPSLRLMKAMESVGAGGAVRLMADDPMVRIDVPHLAAQKGWAVEVGEDAGALSFVVRKPA